MRRKITFTDIMVMLTALFLSIYVVLVINVLKDSLLRDSLSRGFYSGRAIALKPADQAAFLEKANQLDRFILYAPDLDLNRDIRAVAVKGDVGIPPMVSGRFINETDTGAAVAVVGRGVSDTLETVGSKPCFRFDGALYEVVGTMGAEYSSAIDRCVFVSMQRNTDYGTFIIDQSGLTESEAREWFDAEIIDREFNSLSRFFRKEFINLAFYILSLFLFVFCSMNIFSYWLGKRRRAVGIMQMLGFNNHTIARGVLGRYLLYYAAGLALSMIACVIFRSVGVLLEYIAVMEVLIVLSAILLVGFLTILIPIVTLTRKVPVENMRL